jgi:4a-hydroxytetrahydrobiopterin dehydratase
MSLSAKRCEPCQGGDEPMTMEQAERMMGEVPGWEIADSAKRIKRCFKFDNFTQALEFVNKIGEVAEQEQHHPDITFGWGYVTVEVFTHKIGGLHENDFILASKLNERFNA